MFVQVCDFLAKPFQTQTPSKSNREKGMTLIEIIIVIALLGTLMTILVTNLSGTSERAKEDQAKIAMANIAQALQLYRVNVNRYPTTEEGLQALISNPGKPGWRGPYLEENKLNDPWNQPYDYRCSDGINFEIISAGKDSTLGTENDIHYPEKRKDENSAPSN